MPPAMQKVVRRTIVRRCRKAVERGQLHSLGDGRGKTTFQQFLGSF